MELIEKPSPFRGTRTGLLIGLDVTINGGDNTKFDVAPGSYLIKNSRYEFSGATAESTLAGRRSYVFLDPLGNIVLTGVPLLFDDIASKVLIAVIYHPAGPILNIFKGPFDLKNSSWEQNSYNFTSVGPVVTQGVRVIPNSAPPSLSLGAGKLSGIDSSEISVSSVNPLQFIPMYRNGSGGWTFDTITDTIQVANYDGNGSGTLLAMPAGTIRADMLYYSTYDDRFYLLYGQEVQSTFNALHIHQGNYSFQEASDGFFRVQGGVVPVARIYVQENVAVPISVVDSRRVLGLQTLLGLQNIDLEVEEMTKPADLAFLGLIQSMSNVQVFEVGGVVTETVMPKPGFIIAHTTQMDTPITAGVLNMRLTKNGSILGSTALDLQMDVVNPAKRFAAIAPGDLNFQFLANDVIGAQVSTDGAFLPIGSSVTSKIYVKFD